jgi:hypothetical protein
LIPDALAAHYAAAAGGSLLNLPGADIGHAIGEFFLQEKWEKQYRDGA